MQNESPLVEIITGPRQGELFTARTFLDFLRPSHEHWWNEQTNTNPWIFRGHGNSEWSLVPSATRPIGSPDFSRIVERLRSEAQQKLAWWQHKQIGFQEQFLFVKAHRIAMRQFILLARDLNHSVGREMDEITVETIEVLNTDRTLLLDSALQADYTNLPYPLDFVDPGLQASAQHHGIPTFFLDWTRGAIKASHFAILGWDEKTNSNICVWALNKDQLRHRNRFSNFFEAGNIELITPEPGQNEYIDAQSGLFTHIERPGRLWNQNGRCPSLDEILRMRSDKLLGKVITDSLMNYNSSSVSGYFPNTTMRKLELSASEVPSVKKLLLREGISDAHMRPSWDNIATTAMRLAELS